uniref:DUF5641 domain-containing protein n=1 Tax=Anopheles epiroticus TaxID=199890 RepID=A0A182NZC8_9DIPT
MNPTTAFFRYVPVTVYGKGATISTFAFLDEGSSMTLVDEDLAQQLGAQGEREPLCIKWTGDTTRTEPSSMRIDLEIGPATSDKRFSLKAARTVSKLSLPQQTFKMEEGSWEHLQQLPIQEYEDARPKILIGLDNIRLAVPLKTREGSPGDPVAVKCRLGWSVYGKASGVLTQEEIEQAERVLWRQAQEEFFREEVEVLREKGEARNITVSKNSPIYGLLPYADEFGVLRMRGRIGAAPELPYSAKFPVVLPRDSRITYLLVDLFHRRFRHANNETVVNELRQFYQIPKLRRWIREYLPVIAKQTKWFEPVRELVVGDLVLIVDGGVRNQWRRGVVERIIPGTDGRVRQAWVRTSTGTLRRPVAKLALLE